MKAINKPILTIFALLLSIVSAVGSVWTPPVLTELSNSSVSSIAMGSDGYIWVGTRRGLNKFNGSTFIALYKVIDDSSEGVPTLSSDRIMSLLAEDDGILWVGTDTGLNMLQNSKVKRSGVGYFHPVFSLTEYDSENLLYGCSDGLHQYNKETGLDSILYPTSDFTYGCSITVTDNKDIVVVTLGLPAFVLVLPAEGDSRIISLNRAGTIHSAALGFDDRVYIATDKGLVTLKKDSFDPDFSLCQSDSADNLLYVCRDEYTSRMVVLVENEGLFAIDPESGDFIRLIHDKNLDSSFPTYCMVTEDFFCYNNSNRGRLQIRSRQTSNRTVSIDGFTSTEWIQRVITGDDNMAVIQSFEKLLLLNTITGEYKDIFPSDIPQGSFITKSCFDLEGRLWLVVNGSDIRIYSISGTSLSLRGNIDAGKVSAIWANEDQGVSYFDGNRIYRVDRNGNALRSSPMRGDFRSIRCISNIPGQIFFISGNTIYRYTSDMQFAAIPVQADSPNCVCSDHLGNIWLGTLNSGIYCYNPATSSTTRYTTADGLPDNSIKGIIATNSGVWISCRSDVAFIKPDGNIVSFSPDKKDNLEFINNGIATGANGQILFASRDKIFEVFSPKDLRFSSTPINLDALLVNNTLVPEVYSGMSFKNNDNPFVFYYSADDFINGSRINYSYRLSGYDETWVNAGSTTRAFYSHIKPGKHYFEARYLTPDGVEHGPYTIFEFRIKPSPLASPAAIFAYLILFCCLVMLLNFLIRKNRTTHEKLLYSEHEKILLSEIEKDKSDFFINISHELRTPLTLIYGPAKELMKDSLMAARSRELVKTIETNAERMRTLVDEVLELNRSRVDSDKLVTVRSDIAALLRGIVHNFSGLCIDKGLELNSEIPPELIAQTDRNKFEKITFNLISNAIKYTAEGGSIMVSLKQEDDDVVISIADTGIGIPADKKAIIFDRYERILGNVDGTQPEGNGIGLNYAMYLANLHHGRISVRDNSPHGSIFIWRYPGAPGAYAVEEIWHPTFGSNLTAVQTFEPSEEKENSILIAEDNTDMANYIASLLSDNYNVVFAADGDEALKIVRMSSPDLLLSDIMMPYKNGIEVLSEIKSDPVLSHIPVVLLSAKASVQSQIEGIEGGADAYIPKPFDPDYLCSVIKSILENRNRIQSSLSGKTVSEASKVISNLKISRHDRDFLDKLYALVDDNLSDETINVSTIADRMGISRSTLFAKIKSLIGKSPQKFLAEYRLDKAKELLLSGDYNISEVAYKVGFQTLNGFSRAFKARFGMPPSSI